MESLFMSLTKTVGFFAGTTLAIGGVAFGADQTNYAAEIADLKAQIAEMKSQQGDAWLTEQRASEIRGIVTDVLADAETRSSLQGSGAGAGYDGGFFMSSADGNYSMKMNVLEQIRWTFNNRENATAGDDNTWGFENKRTRLTWSGNLVDSSWTYKVAYYFAYSNDVEFNGASEVLADAWVAKDFGNGFKLTVGQFKLPFSGEYGLDAGNLQFNDYSTISNAFADNYGQGLMFGYSADAFRAAVAYVNSLDSVNAAWGAGSPADEYAFTGRAEFKLSGNWDQFNSGSSFKGEEMGILVGVGANWADSNTASVGDVFGATADVTFDFGGANVMGAFYWDNNDGVVAPAGENPWGFTLQGGVFVSDDVEVIARYEMGDADGSAADNDFSAMTLGANWYMAKNTAKMGFNFGYAFDTIGSTWGTAASGNNWLTDAANEDGQWMIQAQMSFSF
jgi:hypothetical protein